MQQPLNFGLQRELIVRVPPAALFAFFTDSARFAAWWGKGSSIEARVGGQVRIVYPNGIVAGGEVLALEIPRQIRFSYGYESGKPMSFGQSVVEFDLEPHPQGTRLLLNHHFGEASQRDHHVQGWRYQLSVFANVATQAHFIHGEETIQNWYAAWNESDPATRHGWLGPIVQPNLEMLDAHSSLVGLLEVEAHLTATREHMAGVSIESHGPTRSCQGHLLSDWSLLREGQVLGRGTNLFELDSCGRIAKVVGFWSGPG